MNIQEPVDPYELPAPGHPCWPDAKPEYEAGLAEFEKRNYRQSAPILADLRSKVPDGPALVQLFRALSGMVQEPGLMELIGRCQESDLTAYHHSRRPLPWPKYSASQGGP